MGKELAGIDELVGEDKVLRQLMHTKVDVKIKECKKCGLEYLLIQNSVISVEKNSKD